MKKLLFALIITVLLLPSTVFAVTAATISSLPATCDKISVTLSVMPTEVDTSYICYRVLGVADTVFYAEIDSTKTSFIIGGLSERTPYIVFQLTRNGDGNTAISNQDTLSTYKIQFQDETKEDGYQQIQLKNATSWPRQGLYEQTVLTWTLTGVGATGSSLLFKEGVYNGLKLIVTSASDSASVTAYIQPAYTKSAWSDTTQYYAAIVDSLQAGEPGAPSEGLFVKELSLPPNGGFILTLVSFTDNVACTVEAILTKND